MSAVQYIQKLGYNEFHHYHYATEADVSEAIRKELAERKVFLLPSVEEVTQRNVTTKKGNEETVTKTRIKFTFLDAENGDSLEFVMEGEGQDPGDKGIYKAITGTTKYALMKAFLIPTGDDPEGDKGVDERSADRVSPRSIVEEDRSEVDPTSGNDIPGYPRLNVVIASMKGKKGVRELRQIAAHAQVEGWNEDQLFIWAEENGVKFGNSEKYNEIVRLRDLIKMQRTGASG